MTGAWARACDAHGDVAREDGDYAEWAVANLGLAMVWPREAVVERVELAGANIRAWRKSLPDQGERWQEGLEHYDDDRLLWLALCSVAIACLHPSVAAENLRVAEAVLRTWWKRSREEQP